MEMIEINIMTVEGQAIRIIYNTNDAGTEWHPTIPIRMDFTGIKITNKTKKKIEAEKERLCKLKKLKRKR